MTVLWCRVPDPDGQRLHRAGLVLLRRGLEARGFRDVPDILNAPGGKPYIPGGPEFSISHSGSLALCAIDEMPLGADVEVLAPIPHELLSALRPPEREYVLSAADGAARERRFYTVWCLRESALKAAGEGIGGFFDLASVVTGDLKINSRVSGLRALVLSLPVPGYAAAVCSAGDRDGEPELVRVDLSDGVEALEL